MLVPFAPLVKSHLREHRPILDHFSSISTVIWPTDLKPLATLPRVLGISFSPDFLSMVPYAVFPLLTSIYLHLYSDL